MKNLREHIGAPPRARVGSMAAALAVVAAVAAAPVLSAAATGPHAAATTHVTRPHTARKAGGTELLAHVGPFGPYVVVGNGPLKGLTLYAITSDTTKTFGCSTVVFHGPGGGSFPCAGPETSQAAEWPALTTTAAPIAGPGITASLLGTTFRKGIGHQVTYGGHPLYLFDQGPGQITGEGWDEPTLPPWHGQWWLVNPDGSFQEWAQTLTSSTLSDGSTVALSALLQTGGGTYPFPLYSYSADTGSTSACGAACARAFEPLLTTGSPGIEGTLSGAIGTITRSDGTTQITYDGHPLYLYGGEKIARVPGRGFTASGNGSGKVVGGGTFSLVTP